MAKEDNQAIKSKRDSFSERLKSKYPDREFADDEALFGQINDDYDEYDERLTGYQDREKKLVDMFNSDPRSAQFLSSWKDGNDPVVELVRRFGTDIKDRLDDPEWQEQLAEANAEFVKRVAQEEELEAEYNTNLDETKENLRTFQGRYGLSDDQLDEVFSVLAGIVGDGLVGKFSVESMELAMKAINHDTDVEDAAAEGEVKGRNAKIDEKLRSRKRGDGVSALNGKNGSAGAARQTPNLGALGNFGESYGTIWDRGNEKRTKYSNT